MTIKAIADTHAVIWYLIGNPRLSFATRSVFTQAISEGKPNSSVSHFVC